MDVCNGRMTEKDVTDGLSDSLIKASKEGEKRDTCLIIWIRDLTQLTLL